MKQAIVAITSTNPTETWKATCVSINRSTQPSRANPGHTKCQIQITVQNLQSGYRVCNQYHTMYDILADSYILHPFNLRASLGRDPEWFQWSGYTKLDADDSPGQQPK